MPLTVRRSLLLLALVAPLLARGQIILSNVNESPTAVSGIETGFYAAQRFVTDSSAASFTLNSVKLQMIGPLNGRNGTNFFVAIYTNDSPSSFRPATMVPNGLLSGEASPTNATINYAYTPTATITLSPNTSYWVVAGVSSGTADFGWNAVASASYTVNVGSWSMPSTNHTSYSTNQGASWAANTPSNWEHQMMEISATAIPEPATGAACLGLAAAVWVVRRRRIPSA